MAGKKPEEGEVIEKNQKALEDAPVAGWVRLMRHACSIWRGARACTDLGAYRLSPSRVPTWVMCTRIWWVRPVWIRTASSEKLLSGADHRVFPFCMCSAPTAHFWHNRHFDLGGGVATNGFKALAFCRRRPGTRARYSLCTSRMAKASLSARRSCSVRATSKMPLVSLSNLCTMPGRWPSILPNCGNRPSSRCTSVCSGHEGQGCTVSPQAYCTQPCGRCHKSSR